MIIKESGRYILQKPGENPRSSKFSNLENLRLYRQYNARDSKRYRLINSLVYNNYLHDDFKYTDDMSDFLRYEKRFETYSNELKKSFRKDRNTLNKLISIEKKIYKTIEKYKQIFKIINNWFLEKDSNETVEDKFEKIEKQFNNIDKETLFYKSYLQLSKGNKDYNLLKSEINKLSMV